MTSSVSPLSFSLDTVYVEVTRGSEEPIRYDLTTIVGELDVFESIETPYLTARLSLVDSAAMSSVINFNGTEKIIIELTPIKAPQLRLEFHVFSVSDFTKDPRNDGVAIYSLELIEAHGFLSSFRRVRRGLSGNISTIIQDLLLTELGVTLAHVDQAEQAARVVVPNLTPLGTAMWLLKRATTEYGEPLYLYSSCRGGVRLRSLGNLLTQEPLIEEPFRYSATPPVDDRFAEMATQIRSMSVDENDNVLRLAKAGAIASRFYSIDPLTRRVDYVDYSAVENFEQRAAAGRTLYDNMLLDTSFTLPDGTAVDTDSHYFSQVATSQAFQDSPGYDEEADYQRHRYKVARQSIAEFLSKQRMNIVVPGYHMLKDTSKGCIGQLIELLVPKDQPIIQDRSTEGVVDKRRSGRWLIARAKHKFTAKGQYLTALTLWRPASEDPLTGSETRPDHR